MRTRFASATEYFQRMVETHVDLFSNVDESWVQFADYLRTRVKSFPAGMIGFFHGACGEGLMSVIDRWVGKGARTLLDPNCDDPDAACFREFDRLPEVLEEVSRFIESLGYAHVFD